MIGIYIILENLYFRFKTWKNFNFLIIISLQPAGSIFLICEVVKLPIAGSNLNLSFKIFLRLYWCLKFKPRQLVVQRGSSNLLNVKFLSLNSFCTDEMVLFGVTEIYLIVTKKKRWEFYQLFFFLKTNKYCAVLKCPIFKNIYFS